jgi:hypothetical protein
MQALTAQLGDETFSGVWIIDGGVVRVACAAGEAAKALHWFQKPGPVAELLLIDLMTKNRKSATVR